MAVFLHYIFANAYFGALEDAAYFSPVAFTTLGYDDMTLTGDSQTLCGIQAINGMILLGWSTAMPFVLDERLWLREERKSMGQY